MHTDGSRSSPESTPDVSLSCVEQILELARWAPSGDNTQPWRFEILDSDRFVVHGHDTQEHCVYDIDGIGSQIAIGALLETIRIAASIHGLGCDLSRRAGMTDRQPTYDVRLVHTPQVAPDPLSRFIRSRVTQRRPMSRRPITGQERVALESSVGKSFTVIWIGHTTEKLRMARMLFRNAHIRLTIPEAYAVHRDIIEWRARFSDDRIPDQAIGLDPVSTRLMQWVMHSWKRIRFMNMFLAGTMLPRVQLDLLPAFFCGSHFLIVADQIPQSVDDFVAAGRALQKFWLTVTSLGLLLQPEMTPMIFSLYVRQQRRFTSSARAWQRAVALSEQLDRFVGGDRKDKIVFMGRIGAGQAPRSRSTRLSLDRLIHKAH